MVLRTYLERYLQKDISSFNYNGWLYTVNKIDDKLKLVFATTNIFDADENKVGIYSVKQKGFVFVFRKNRDWDILLDPIDKNELSKVEDYTSFTLNLKKAICKIEPDLLKSLILNLIDNALKSMNSGGILTVEDRATQEGAKIYISDTGCGMPKDEISKITEAFYRIDKSRSRKQGGVGLGLAICKEIVRIHQGEMRFISQQGKGTTVIITIGGGAYEKTN